MNKTDLYMMINHSSGYRREIAVRRLGMVGDPLDIALLITRVNDWVPQVRDAAKNALISMLLPVNSQVFTACLPDIFHLNNCGRENHSEFITKIIEYLALPENKHALLKSLNSDKLNVTRFAMKLALDYIPEERDQITLTCLRHSDVLVRKISADNLRHLSASKLTTALEIALKDPFMPVRREAFKIQLKSQPAVKQMTAQKYLYDKHSSIREIAINTLLNSGTDVNRLYSNSLSDQYASILQIKCSILGLAKLKAYEETLNILRLQNHKTPSIRKSVIQALATLHAEEYKMTYVDRLSDQSLNVAREAYRIISRLKISFKSDEISNAIPLFSYPQTLKLVLRAMRHSNKWERLIFLLHLLNVTSAADHANNDLLFEELGAWDRDVNNSYNQPTDQQIITLRTEYAHCSAAVNSHAYNSIEFTLKTNNVL